MIRINNSWVSLGTWADNQEWRDNDSSIRRVENYTSDLSLWLNDLSAVDANRGKLGEDTLLEGNDYA